jgi:methylated-DNA-[protein]-cysteine S-methyltransferase
MLTLKSPSPHAATTTHTTIESPLGELTTVARSKGVAGLYFSSHWYRPDRSTFGDRAEEKFENLRPQLSEYFAGERQGFDISLDANGDELHRKVWDLVRQVPYGQTSTYGQLARELGDGTTLRAVGAAVGRNPLCILIPCHRIVGANGKLTGYAGGLRRKQFLLDLETTTAERPSRLF